MTQDFNDWGSDPDDADKVAAREITLTWCKSWEISKVPLGSAELWQFGPNGPPMNVMDTCSVSKMVWIANQTLGHNVCHICRAHHVLQWLSSRNNFNQFTVK